MLAEQRGWRHTYMNIRLERKDDYTQVEELTREAFWNLYFPGCNEHYLCHILRGHKDFISELDYVVELDGKIVASIMYTHSYLINNDEETVQTVSFGPPVVFRGRTKISRCKKNKYLKKACV